MTKHGAAVMLVQRKSEVILRKSDNDRFRHFTGETRSLAFYWGKGRRRF